MKLTVHNLKRKFNLFVSFLAISIFSSQCFAQSSTNSSSSKKFSYLNKFDSMFQFVLQNYVDEVDPRVLYEGAMKGMMDSLGDPYTSYLDEDTMRDLSDTTNGSFGGVGLSISKPIESKPDKPAYVEVASPIEDTPAEKAGLLADDEILSIDGESTKGITVDKAADRIRGEEGTQVTLVIKRKGVEEPQSYTITRAEIEIKSVTQKVPTEIKMPDDICYIRLSSFISRNASKEVRSIIEANPNKKSYIIDLRSNPGGLLSNAIYISDMFLNGGDIVSTVDRDGYKETQKASRGVLTTKPLVILLNKGSASASEIFSGAMKDNKRAVLVGTQSFGKGLVQEINKLPNNAGVNITIQKYLTPSGTDIHKKGITPDVIVELTDEQVKNKDDAQLKKAIEIAQSLQKGTYVVSK